MAISNSRLLAMDERGVTFRWKDYQAKGKTPHKAMTLCPQEFMRRFLLHVLPGGFHRIRHYGLLANSNRRDNLALARALMHASSPPPGESVDEASTAPAPTFVCARCGHAMVVLQVFLRDCSIRGPASAMTEPHQRRSTRRRMRRQVDVCVRCANACLGSPTGGQGGSEVARLKPSALVGMVSTRRHAQLNRDAGVDQSP